VDVVANSAGETGSVRSAELTPQQRALFELQLAAYRAARDLVQACDIAVMTGMPVHEDMVAAWSTARNRWRWMRRDIRTNQRGPA
jgi:beta-glucosidase-like glycosyl hydrolase